MLYVPFAIADATALTEAGGRRITLAKQLGETVAEGEERPMWNWPAR